MDAEEINTKIVGYVRVSTDAQVEQGLGLEVQEQQLRAWAKAHGHKIVEIFVEPGVSGAKGLEDRPALAEALHALRHGLAGGLVVPRLDRLARDLVLQEQLLAEVKRLKAQAFSTMAGEDAYLVDDPDDPSRKLIRHILGAVSEYERAMISMRLRSGRARKAANGGYATGAPPLGLRAVGGALVEDPDEGRVLDRLLTLRTDGRSLREIAALLTAEGLRPKRSDRWHPETVRKALVRAQGRHDGPVPGPRSPSPQKAA